MRASSYRLRTSIFVARRLLKSLSVKQGQKFDSPESAREIMPFIAFHNLRIEEVADPLESYSTCLSCIYTSLGCLTILLFPPGTLVLRNLQSVLL